MSLLSGSGLAVWVLHLFLGQILQLVSGATLPVGFLIGCLGVSLPFGKPCCLGVSLPFGNVFP